MIIFQMFYQLTVCLPLSNDLLITPDGDLPTGEHRVNMKSLYDMFRHTNSHGLVSLPFLGILQYYLERNDFSLIKNSLTELYSNLSYITLSGARDFELEEVLDLVSKLSFLSKTATRLNIQERGESHTQYAYNINKDRLFIPKIEDPLDEVIDILGDKYIEHKTELHPYVPPQVQTADEIERETQLVDDDFAQLKAEYDQINDVATEQKKQNKITDLVDDIIDETNTILSDNLSVSKHTGPPQSKKYITTRMTTTVKNANKIKDKYKKQLQRKKIGKIKTSSNTPDDNEKPNREVTRTDNPNKPPVFP